MPPNPTPDELLDLYATWLGARLTLGDTHPSNPYPLAGRDHAPQLLKESERELLALGLIRHRASNTQEGGE